MMKLARHCAIFHFRVILLEIPTQPSFSFYDERFRCAKSLSAIKEECDDKIMSEIKTYRMTGMIIYLNSFINTSKY